MGGGCEKTFRQECALVWATECCCDQDRLGTRRLHAVRVTRSSGATNTTPATLACAFSAHQGAGGYGLLGRYLFNLDLARPVSPLFQWSAQKPGFAHRTDLLYPQRQIMVSEMLASRYLRGTAGRTVSVAPKKLARTLILTLGILGLNSAGQGCHCQKSTDSPSLELTKIPPAAQGGRERIDTIAGRVRNAHLKQQIVIYAHSGPWWVQPWPPYLGS